MMKAFSRAFLAFIVVSGLVLASVTDLVVVQASTDVEGIIGSDTTWTNAGSPYSLVGNVLVGNGATLTIETGATVNLGDFYIMVNGTLRAQGTETEQIQFNGGEITFTPHSSDWNEQTGSGSIIEYAELGSTPLGTSSVSLKISNNHLLSLAIGGGSIVSGNTVVEQMTVNSGDYSALVSHNTVLGGARVSGASVVNFNTISGGTVISNDSPVISNNTLYDGVDVAGGSPVISDNIISGGLEAHEPSTKYSAYSPTITGNTISGGVTLHSNEEVLALSFNTISGGVFVSNGYVVISNNTIDGGIDLAPAGNNKVNATIINNNILGEEIGIFLAPTSSVFLYASSRTDAYISGNIISGCTTAAIQDGGVGMSQAGHPSLYNNATVEDNIIFDNNYGIDGGILVRNNIVVNNMYGIDGGSLIEGNIVIDNTYGINGGKEIRNNLIMNNTYGISGGTVIIANTIVNNVVGVESGFTTFAHNNIYNNSEYNLRFTASNNTNAAHNWWGTTDAQAINQTIYDYKKDFYLGTVNFLPLLAEPNPEAPPIQMPTIPDATAIPEFPTWAILPLLLGVSSFVLLYRKQMKIFGEHRHEHSQ